MDVVNRDLLGLIAAILLLIIRQSSINKTIQQFFCKETLKKALSTMLPSRFFWHFIYIYELVAWVFPQPQNWFQQLLNSNTLDHWWKENFRVSHDTF